MCLYHKTATTTKSLNKEADNYPAGLFSAAWRHEKQQQVVTDQNTATPSRSSERSPPHEKCIVPSPVASLHGESQEGSGGVLLYRQQAGVSDGSVELVSIIWQLEDHSLDYFTHQAELG